MQNQEIAHDAVPVLRENLDTIHTVTEWAEALGYSRAYFSVLVKQKLEKPPAQIIRREKLKKIRSCVRENPDLKGLIIANKTGFKNVKSLYKFLSYHYNISLTAMRNRMQNKR